MGKKLIDHQAYQACKKLGDLQQRSTSTSSRAASSRCRRRDAHRPPSLRSAQSSAAEPGRSTLDERGPAGPSPVGAAAAGKLARCLVTPVAALVVSCLRSRPPAAAAAATRSASTTEPATTTLRRAGQPRRARARGAAAGHDQRHEAEKGSATGAGVFGGDAFSREMTQRLQAAGKAPADLRFANAEDPKGKLELEVGVFQVPGLAGTALADAIVASSRPNAPGLIAEHSTLGGKPVTTIVYPGGTCSTSTSTAAASSTSAPRTRRSP